MIVKEMAHLCEQIAPQYRAAQWDVTELAFETNCCAFIMIYMKNMKINREILEHYISNGQKSILLTEILASLPEQPERFAVLNILRHFFGNAEETEHLIDYIQEMWETIDLLVQRFGKEATRKIIHAPGVKFSDSSVS